MKRIISLTLAVLLIAALFAGCAGSKADSPVGTYVIKTINDKSVKDYFTEAFGAASEEGFDMSALLAMMGIDLEHPEDLMQITLKEDGTVEFTSKLDEIGEAEEGEEVEGEEKETGTWKQDGDKIIISADGEDTELGYKNGELTMTTEEGGETVSMVLAKQK